MVLWHAGLAALLTYVTLGRRRIDYRYVLAGAVLPDVVDGALELLVFGDGAGRYVAHTLLAPLIVAAAVVGTLRGERRLRAFGLFVGWLLHLVGDGMWGAPRIFLWPAFGTAFETAPPEPYSWALFTAPAEHIWVWLGEAAGLAVLWWFWVAFRLGEDARFRRFLKDGYLRP